MYKYLSSKVLLFFTLLFFKTLVVFAQGLCGNVKGAEKGGFTLDKYYSCTIPATINITNTSGVNNVQYVFVYNGQDEDSLIYLQPSPTPSYTYLADGVYTILQYGTKNGKPMYACQELTVTSNPKPELSYIACNLNYMEVQVPKSATNTSYDKLELTIQGYPTITIDKSALPFTKTQSFSVPYSNSKTLTLKGIPNPSSGCPPSTRSLNADMTGALDRTMISAIDMSPDGNTATLKINGAKGVDYNLYMHENGQAFDLNPLKKVQSGYVSIQVPDSAKSYCFQVYRPATCIDFSTEICTLPPSVVIDGYQNTINIPSHPILLKSPVYSPTNLIYSNIQTQITKISRIDPTGSNIPLTVIGNTTANDLPPDCRKVTCYQITVEITQKDANNRDYKTTLKQKYCVDRSKIQAPPIKVGAVSVDAGNKIDLIYDDVVNWKIKRDTFFVFRASDKISFKQIAFQTAPAPYKDAAIDASKQQYCYKVGYVDECGSRSKDSLIFCSIFLQAQNQDLVWTPETPYQNLVSSYTVEKFDETTNAISDDATIAAPKVTHTPDLSQNEYKGIFRIKTPTNNGNFSYSNIVTIPIIPAVYLPTAFTPNGDNSPAVNEKFTLSGHTRRFDEFMMQIFNRWGNVVFESKDPKIGWNGKINNHDAPEGPYSYAIDVQLDTGEKLRWSGIVMLLR